MTSRWWPGLMVATCMLWTLEVSLSPLVGLETDIWWHLAAGKRCLDHGLELTDPFSCTFFGQFWIRIDWLFQLIAYCIYALTGMAGLLGWRSLLLMASSGLVMLSLRRQGVGWARLALVAGMCASIWGAATGIRPATLSFFFTTVWVFLLEEARQGRRRALGFLPWLMVLWYNCHVAGLAGLLLLGLYVGGQALDGWRRRDLRWSNMAAWLRALPLCLLATLITPQPGQLLYYPIQFLIFKSPWNRMIVEVQPASWDTAGTPVARLLLFVAVLGALERAFRGQTTGLWVCLVCGFLMNSTYRHQFQLCPALAPWAAVALMQARWSGLSPRGLRALLALLALGICLRSAAAVAMSRWPLMGLIRQESYPIVQADWLARYPAGTAVFTDMNCAGYYLFRFGGEQKLFIDSRTDQVYARHDFVAHYWEILTGGPGAMDLLKRYKVDAVAVQTGVNGPHSLLDQRLINSQDWGLPAYQDNIGRVYVRQGLPRPAAPQAEDYLLAYNQGRALQQMGQNQQAIGLLHESLRHYPQFAYAHLALAEIWLAEGQITKARQQLAWAELFHPDRGLVEPLWPRLVEQGVWAGWSRYPWLRWWCLPFLVL